MAELYRSIDPVLEELQSKRRQADAKYDRQWATRLGGAITSAIGVVFMGANTVLATVEGWSAENAGGVATATVFAIGGSAVAYCAHRQLPELDIRTKQAKLMVDDYIGLYND